VTDTSAGVLPGVTVTITNIETGAERSVTTNADGFYRALLLPLGRYQVVAELQGFKKFNRSGITLQAGDVANVNVSTPTMTISINTMIRALPCWRFGPWTFPPPLMTVMSAARVIGRPWRHT